MTPLEKNYDFVVVGGGLSGVCAAIAAARHGAKTALLQDRPVLGGNASSEIRMHICGADMHERRAHARETGIILELLLENRKQNPQNSFSMLDSVLWEKVRFQQNLDLYLNTHMTQVLMAQPGAIDAQAQQGEVPICKTPAHNVPSEGKSATICAVVAKQMTTEKTFCFKAPLFADMTGDATLAALAGAQYAIGRESKETYGEPHAPEVADPYTMGNSIMFEAKDMGHPVPFTAPHWAKKFSEEDLAKRGIKDFHSGYWWIELGGKDKRIIEEGEEIADDLRSAVFGIWDYIKNSGKFAAENFALGWVGALPGKRESRRIIGDVVLTEADLAQARVFEDAVAYGGWTMDVHVVGGLENSGERANQFLPVPDVYTIPYRALYSKNIQNLYVGGRALSASHLAMSSTRVMATCAVAGQAIGTAAAMAAQKGVQPRALLAEINALQQTLLKDDCYIPGYQNHDEADFIRFGNCSFTASSAQQGCDAALVANGVARTIKEEANAWVSAASVQEAPQWLGIAFGAVRRVGQLHLKFDPNLSKQVFTTLSREHTKADSACLPATLVRAFRVDFCRDGKVLQTVRVQQNHQRFVVVSPAAALQCDGVKIWVDETYGDAYARIFEVRGYENIATDRA